MSKAYDRVEWSFLEGVMLRMGFDEKWVAIMAETIGSVNYHILHEQQQFGPIIPGRGLWQGDPLSPYLYLFVAEGLSVLIDHQMRSTAEECVKMKWVLDTFSAASGQQINYDKSLLCFSSNVQQHSRLELASVLGVNEGDTTGKYLGLPSLVGRRKKEILGFLKEKVLSRVRS
ncbi:PREDICTED: uncharacterized protein LOC109158596 [Ipomoea nil]|uniref:uncharacterized protein LOC109158596 n=1 Tax=Ipomoea nil TaxID=35883 RepID=UPI000901EE13|nr:PREDICTED: uncharacterized protein LOC109158596 [Ipomoea nil]